MNFLTFLWILLLCVCLELTTSSKLNVPRVLLPIFSDFSTKFTLEATEGDCYKWTTSRTDLINLIPDDVNPDEGCSTKVTVITVTKEKTRNIAVVLAEDMQTRQILRCDVIVDVIDSLALITTTRELFVEEAPEAFEVRAYDAQGNEFTTVDDVEFNWSIICLNQKKDATVLRLITFKDSPYETPPSIGKLEDQNKRGHTVLLEGIQTGSARVFVKLPYDEYKHVRGYEVQLSVIANIIMSPADVYLMVGDTVQFRIIQMNNGRMINIELSASQYYLIIEDDSIASIDKGTGKVTGLTEGKTKVILQDTYSDENDGSLKLPSATINVVVPAYMTLNILPHRNWIILLSEKHQIVVELYTSDNHRLHLGPGTKINTTITEQFYVKECEINGSWLTGWAKEQGIAQIHSHLIDSLPEISAKADILIYPHIILKPEQVILPWDPQLKPKYQIDVKASGGDGKYTWSSSNGSIGIVTQFGHVTTQSHGFFHVSAAMMANHRNKESAMFYILPPERLEIVEYVMEAEVGSNIYLHLALYGAKPIKSSNKIIEVPFTKCKDLPFKIEMSDSNFVLNETGTTDLVGISCANVALVSQTVGVSKVTVSYTIDGRVLEDTATINTFEPLQLIHPRYKDVLLAVGTSLHLVFKGGPRPVIGRSSVHKRFVTTDDEEVVKTEDISDFNDQLIVLNVQCLKLGVSSVKLSVVNSPMLENCKNQEFSYMVTVICGKPRAISFRPQLKVADKRACPMDLNAQRVVVQSSNQIELEVTVLDEIGRIFLNISSLKFEWTLSPADEGKFGVVDGTFSRNETEGFIIYANGSYQTVESNFKVGILEVYVKLIGYHKDLLWNYGIIPEWPEFLSQDEKSLQLHEIKSNIFLYLSGDAAVTPSAISLYNHPLNKKIVVVEQGSGFYEISLSASNLVDVKYLEGRRELEIVPLNEGEVHISLIDLCLVSSPALIQVYVVSVNKIRIEMSDKVEINKCISCIVRLYDDFDNLMSLPDMDIINMEISQSKEIARITQMKEIENGSLSIGEMHYIITGVELGDAQLVFSIGKTSSSPMDLQVFSPLRIYPKNTTLILGSVLQFYSKGGPQPSNNIEYIVHTKNIANISNAGVAQGLKIGHTRIDAYAVGWNSISGAKITYSQDHVDLRVISISGVKIFVPLSRFKIGRTIPAWVYGLPEQVSPMILGTLHKPFKFEWSVDDGDVIKIEGAFARHNIKYLPEDDLLVHLTGLSFGRTSLRVKVTIPGPTAEQFDRLHVSYTATIEIEVYNELAFIHPKSIPGESLLMTPYSNLQLHTNMDSFNNIKYILPATGVLSSEETEESLGKSLSLPNPIITVSDTGFVQSYGLLGSVTVLVTSTDEYGLKQTLTIAIHVKTIHYVLLRPEIKWYAHSALHTIPLGVEFELKATYHDDTGSQFSSGNVVLKLLSTRFDLVRLRAGADNSTFIITTKNVGHSVLKAYVVGAANTVAFIKLHIESVVLPNIQQVTTGDILCMWTPLVSHFEEESTWTSSDNKVLLLNEGSGIGQVIATEFSTVTIGHSLHLGAPLKLQVVPASKIKMLQDTKAVLTNAVDASVYRVSLVITNTKVGTSGKNLRNGWECRDQLKKVMIRYPFSCHYIFENEALEIDGDKVFIAESGFDFVKGQYTCDLYPGTAYGLNMSTAIGNVLIWAELFDGNLQAEPVTVPFIPAIYVDHILQMTDDNSVVLSVFGIEEVLNQIEVSVLDINLLEVMPLTRSESNVLKYRVRLLDYHWKLDDSLNITVKSKLTNQRVQIHVKVDPNKFRDSMTHSPIVNYIFGYRHVLALIASVLLLLFAVLYVYSAYIQPIINVNVNPNRSLLSFNEQMGGSSPRSQYLGNMNNYTSSSQSKSGSPVSSRHVTFINKDPVYGDPRTFYSTSPELRRHRRFI